MVRSENTIADIPILKIRPNRAQPRKIFEENELTALSQSISENGILQPLTVRKVTNTEYELIAGERRLRAAVLAGLRKVPCIVVRCSEKESAVYALLENLQRADLGIFEEARGIARLIRRYGLTQEQAASKLGKTQSTIANKLRLLRLSEEEQEWIEKAGLGERHARALLRLENEYVRRNSTPAPKKSKGNSKAVIKDIRIFLNTINKAIDTMRLSGINAEANKTDTNDFIEYTIRIPKSAIYSPDKSA